ncbi:hypothetical protein OEZ85_013491 [Tetradesmus obliquus]|uniref:Nuclear pore complex protein NUP96 C-terminal domain-containing protein n=1 Tax=Tetradesmus obliquus TaxID=3088 RepID=A0ABY8UTY7_TETOB|nr:hypothetical protein OEZ85_013491 [Tetradesmus obliquus]
MRDLWQLVKVLYEYRDGEDGSSSKNDNEDNNVTAAAAAADGADSPTESLATPEGQSQASEEDADDTSQGLGLNGLGGLGSSRRDSSGLGFEHGGSSSSRVQLAAFQRKAALSKWLQRKLKPAVTAAIQKVITKSNNVPGQQPQDALLWAVLHLMSGRQAAAAVAVAVAAGDTRLATLLAAAGQAAAGAGGANIVQQVQAWARAGLLPGHFCTPRRLLLALLAAAAPAAAGVGGQGGLLDVASALQLEWSRAFGLWLWYGLPSTEPVAAVTRAFTAALAAAPQLPRPVPPHSSSSSSSKQPDTAAAAAAAPADTQYALLQLHALGAHGLNLGLLNCYPSAADGGGFGSDSYNSCHNSVSNGQGSTVGELVAQLLRVAGHSSNPLDCSTAWQLLGVLQAVGALPARQQEYERVAIALCGSFAAQLLLLNSPAAAVWAPFVALHIPSDSGGIAMPGAREAAIQRLLQVTAPQWADDPQLVGWLRSMLGLPLPWLHSAQATWHGYCGRSSLQLLAVPLCTWPFLI